MGRSVAEGRFQVPTNWPRWKLQCQANTHGGKTQCRHWAVIGMPTCRMHGSGGKANAELGELRYLAWIVLGGPQNMPVAHACRLAFAVFAEAVLNKGTGSPIQQMKAALWITQRLAGGAEL